jgi:hypothetical protein
MQAETQHKILHSWFGKWARLILLLTLATGCASTAPPDEKRNCAAPACSIGTCNPFHRKPLAR